MATVTISVSHLSLLSTRAAEEAMETVERGHWRDSRRGEECGTRSAHYKYPEIKYACAAHAAGGKYESSPGADGKHTTSKTFK